MDMAVARAAGVAALKSKALAALAAQRGQAKEGKERKVRKKAREKRVACVTPRGESAKALDEVNKFKKQACPASGRSSQAARTKGHSQDWGMRRPAV